MAEIIQSIEVSGGSAVIVTDRARITLSDDMQQCCEHRHMTCDDDLSVFVGREYLGWRLVDAGKTQYEPAFAEVHDVQFLEILTSLGPVSVASHNEHNGYYSGFHIVEYRQ